MATLQRSAPAALEGANSCGPREPSSARQTTLLKKAAMRKEKPAIRICRLRICGVDGDWHEARRRWRALGLEVQRVLNDLRAVWLAEHYRRADHVAVRQWIASDMAWAKTAKADRQPRRRVPCPVKCWDAEMGRHVWRELTALHPGLHSRVMTLAINIEQKTLGSAPASTSAYPRWMKILAGEEGIPNSSRHQPIPFDKHNGRLIPPDEPGKPWRFLVRVDRIASDTESKPATSTADVLHLKSGGRNLAGVRKTLDRIASGQYAFKGSSLAVRDGIWYILLSHTIPQPPRAEVDPDRVAYLSPASDRPVHLWLDGWPHYLARQGRDVAHVRRQLLTQRFGRSESYKLASSAQRGHGRKKWLGKLDKLRRRWRDFVKTYNERLASDTVAACVARGFGSLIYYQPEGRRARRRFLARVGHVPDRRDSTGWDWFQLKTLLARRCQELGIEFSARKIGGSPHSQRSNGR